MEEIWLLIPEAGGFYEASSLGRIRSKDRVFEVGSRWGGTRLLPFKGKVLKPWPDAGGYLVVYLANRKAVNVHRLIASAFHGNGTGLDVNHIDGNKQNNCADNLEWVTRKENMAHARATGLLRDTKAVIGTPVRGGPQIRFESTSAAGRDLGVYSHANIAAVANGKWKTAYGYRWKYEDELEAA